jgi:hypothetical protein
MSINRVTGTPSRVKGKPMVSVFVNGGRGKDMSPSEARQLASSLGEAGDQLLRAAKEAEEMDPLG